MYKAIRNIKVTFSNNKVKEITLISFDNANDSVKAKLERQVMHYALNPKTVKIETISEYIEAF